MSTFSGRMWFFDVSGKLHVCGLGRIILFCSPSWYGFAVKPLATYLTYFSTCNKIIRSVTQNTDISNSCEILRSWDTSHHKSMGSFLYSNSLIIPSDAGIQHNFLHPYFYILVLSVACELLVPLWVHKSFQAGMACLKLWLYCLMLGGPSHATVNTSLMLSLFCSQSSWF